MPKYVDVEKIHAQIMDAFETALEVIETENAVELPDGWISVKDRLPEENEYVVIWCKGDCQIARIERGISEEERSAMMRGELPDPKVYCYGKDGVTAHKRSSLYYGCDVHGNNTVPYRWKANGGPMDWFGQDVTHWMPLPKPPKED